MGKTKPTNDDTNESTITVKQDEGMDVDEVILAAGGFGKFQAILLLVLVYLVLTIGQHFVSSVFTGPDPPWR